MKIDTAQPPNPGHVTIPRLTRDEYNNTLRDLLGIDFHPGDGFTADGEGSSGFNTDRDALFLTPAQLEKYLAAADTALDACLALEHDPARLRLELEDMFMTETSRRASRFRRWLSRLCAEPRPDDPLRFGAVSGRWLLHVTVRALGTPGPSGAGSASTAKHAAISRPRQPPATFDHLLRQIRQPADDLEHRAAGAGHAACSTAALALGRNRLQSRTTNPR